MLVSLISASIFLMMPLASTSMNLHEHMNAEELAHYFEASESHEVDPREYQLAPLVRHDSRMVKRGGGFEHHHRLSLSAFGRSYSLGLKRNTDLLYQQAQVVLLEDDGSERTLDVARGHSSCHYQVADGRFSGSFSSCGHGFDVGGDGDDGDDVNYRGAFKDGRDLFEVLPLRPRLKGILTQHSRGMHLVRLASNRTVTFDGARTTTRERLDRLRRMEDEVQDKARAKLMVIDAVERQLEKKLREEQQRQDNNRTREFLRPSMRKRGYGSTSPLTVEIAVFFDCAATRTYLRYYDDKAEEVVDFMLSLVNAMQGIYNYPSLGRPIILVVTYAKLNKGCKIEEYGGEREDMLKSFCKYQKDVKKRESKRWDVALLMSGIDMYGVDGGRKSFATMGLSTVTGTCEADYECVIGEVGVRDQYGKPYPSAGFGAVLVMVHEIAHNFGLHHDATPQTEFAGCSREGGIMSPTRSNAGECEWSRCSRDFVRRIDESMLPCLFDSPPEPAADHNKFGDAVGMRVTADEQCKTLMFDREAVVDEEKSGGMDKICHAMVCKSNRKRASQPGSPALPGTSCGGGRRCLEGKCVKHDFKGPPKPPKTPKWSEWREGSCRSSCIERSKPTTHAHRTCSSFSGCSGPNTKVELCGNPTNECPLQRSPRDFATLMCLKFKKVSSYLDRQLDGEGKKVDYNKLYPKRACAIHCLAKGSSSYFAPVLEFENSDLDGYSPNFPDGTHCGTVGGKDFYCIEGECLRDGRKSRDGRSANADEGYGKVRSADPYEDPDDLPLDPFFMTNDDGSPAADPPADDGANAVGIDIVVDEPVPKWK